MAKGKKTGGRVKGVPNELTTGAKEVIAQVAENIGGVARMTKWARESPENEKAFWTTIYTKLLPLQVAGDKDNPLSIHRIERTIIERVSPEERLLSAPATYDQIAAEGECNFEKPPVTINPGRHWSE